MWPPPRRPSTASPPRREWAQPPPLTPPAAVFEISNILNTGLDREALSICVSLCESGVNPEALAAVVTELRREKSILDERAQGE